MQTNNKTRAALVLTTLGGLGGSALAQAPVDVSALGTTLAGYVPTAAAAGLAVFAAIIGAKLIIRAFKAVMG